MSPRRGTRSLGRGALSRRTVVWIAVIVVVLVVVDVVLVALALGRTAPTRNGSPGPIPTYSSSPIPTSTATPTTTPTVDATADPATRVASDRRLLSAVNAQEAWRTSSGTCDGEKAVLEHTVDGGVAWMHVRLAPDVRTVLALRAGQGTVSVIAGTGDECTPVVRTSTDDGATWTDAAAGAAGAGIGADGLILRSGTVEAPCQDPAEVFQGVRTTAVICTDEIEWRTSSAAWVKVSVSGVRSLAVDGDVYTLARTGTETCGGVRIDSMRAAGVTENTQTTPIGCAVDADGATSVVIARAGQVVWLWSAGTTLVSHDGGVSW